MNAEVRRLHILSAEGEHNGNPIKLAVKDALFLIAPPSGELEN